MNPTRKRSLLVATLGTAVASGSLLAIDSARRHEHGTPATASAQTTQSQQAVTAGGLEQAAAAGRQAMSYISAARQLLAGPAGKTPRAEEAGKYLQRARDLLASLDARRGSDAARSGNSVIPLYSQLRAREGADSSERVQQGLAQLQGDFARGKHDKVTEALRLSGVEMQYSYVDLPLDATLSKLEQAIQALDEHRDRQAADILAAAERGLLRDTITVNRHDAQPAS